MINQLGFIQIPVLILLIVVFSGAGYATYKIKGPLQETTTLGVAIESPRTTTKVPAEAEIIIDEKGLEIKEESDSLIISPKKQVKDLAKEVSRPQAEAPVGELPKVSIIALPSGAIVEMDTDGNITRTIKEASTGVSVPHISPNQNVTPIPTQTGSTSPEQKARTLTTYVDTSNKPVNGCIRAIVYVFVKENGKELNDVEVTFHNPETGVDEKNTTYLVGRVVPDNPNGNVQYSNMHTGARFIFDPKIHQSLYTLGFTAENINTVLTVTCAQQ